MSIHRVETIPPPDGEEASDKETSVADWSLALEEMRRAATSAKATRKVEAFDLDAALATEAEALPVIVAEVTVDVDAPAAAPPRPQPQPQPTPRRSDGWGVILLFVVVVVGMLLLGR